MSRNSKREEARQKKKKIQNYFSNSYPPVVKSLARPVKRIIRDLVRKNKGQLMASQENGNTVISKVEEVKENA